MPNRAPSARLSASAPSAADPVAKLAEPDMDFALIEHGLPKPAEAVDLVATGMINC